MPTLAFDAHKIPIAMWALTIWESWIPASVCNQLIKEAKAVLDIARSVWPHVKGPATAVVATATLAAAPAAEQAAWAAWAVPTATARGR